LAADESSFWLRKYPEFCAAKCLKSFPTEGKRSTYRTTKRGRVLKILRRVYARCHPGTRRSAELLGLRETSPFHL
jgi:hypothetical protein